MSYRERKELLTSNGNTWVESPGFFCGARFVGTQVNNCAYVFILVRKYIAFVFVRFMDIALFGFAL